MSLALFKAALVDELRQAMAYVQPASAVLTDVQPVQVDYWRGRLSAVDG